VVRVEGAMAEARVEAEMAAVMVVGKDEAGKVVEVTVAEGMAEAVRVEVARAEARVEVEMVAPVMAVAREEVEETAVLRVETVRVEGVRAKVAAATAKVAATGTAAAAMVEVAHWEADRMTVAPPPGTCSGHSGGGGGWNAARVQATMLPRKVQGWAKETRRRSLALCECRLPKKLLEL